MEPPRKPRSGATNSSTVWRRRSPNAAAASPSPSIATAPAADRISVMPLAARISSTASRRRTPNAAPVTSTASRRRTPDAAPVTSTASRRRTPDAATATSSSRRAPRAATATSSWSSSSSRRFSPNAAATASVSGAIAATAPPPSSSVAVRCSVDVTREYVDDNKQTGEFLLAAKLDPPNRAEPPELSVPSVRIWLSSYGGKWPVVCRVEAAAGNLLLFLARVRLGSHDPYYFLVHDDATDGSLSVIPRANRNVPPQGVAIPNGGLPLLFFAPPVILPLNDGTSSYVLADLALSDAGGVCVPILYLWSSSSSSRTWRIKAARYPPKMVADGTHRKCLPSVSFMFQGKAFWVDLHFGVLYCDMLPFLNGGDPDTVDLHFIGMPPDCPVSGCANRYMQKKERTMAVVSDDSIRLVVIDGFHKYCSAKKLSSVPRDVVIMSWTLKPHPWEWKADKGMTLPLQELWVSQKFSKQKLPQRLPMKPILSTQEDGIIYLLVGDNYIDGYRMMTRGEYILRVDMRRKALLSSYRLPPLSCSNASNSNPDVLEEKNIVHQPDFLVVNSWEVIDSTYVSYKMRPSLRQDLQSYNAQMVHRAPLVAAACI